MAILRKTIPLFLVAGLCLAATCERPVELDIDRPPDRLVVNGSFTPGQEVRVAVSRSQSILDDDPPEYLADATVTLYEGNVLREELELFIEQNAARIPPYYVTKSFKPQAGATYTIRVAAPGFQTVEAHSFIPEPVPLTLLRASRLMESPGGSQYSRTFTYHVDLNFDDPPYEDNFYHLNIFQEIFDIALTADGDTVINDRRLERLVLEPEDASIIRDAMLGGLLLKNNPQKDGYGFDVAVDIVPEFVALGHIYAELRTVSREYYLYYTTFSRQRNQSDGPFNDPIVIYNNVENGHGYFAGYNSVRDSVSLGF